MAGVAVPLRKPLAARWYWAVDAAWKRVVETGPKWFMDNVWRTCLYYVRSSNAWCGRGQYRKDFDRDA